MIHSRVAKDEITMTLARKFVVNDISGNTTALRNNAFFH